MMSHEEYLKKLQDPLWYGEQDENGVDLSLIRENLKLTPRERLLQGDRARRNALRLMEYGRRQREEDSRRERSGGLPLRDPIRLELDADHALVLFDLLSRFEDTELLSVENEAEKRVLWNLHGLLEQQLVESFDENYDALVVAARLRLQDPRD
jgi:hypothetical protein